jgi:hypothetical protein
MDEAGYSGAEREGALPVINTSAAAFASVKAMAKAKARNSPLILTLSV